MVGPLAKPEGECSRLGIALHRPNLRLDMKCLGVPLIAHRLRGARRYSKEGVFKPGDLCDSSSEAFRVDLEEIQGEAAIGRQLFVGVLKISLQRPWRMLMGDPIERNER